MLIPFSPVPPAPIPSPPPGPGPTSGTARAGSRGIWKDTRLRPLTA